MLDGIWRVYKHGAYIGTFETCIGADALVVDRYDAIKFDCDDILHMDETHTKKAWEVKVIKREPKSSGKILIYFKKISDRPSQYFEPEKPEKKFLGIFRKK